MVDVAEADDCHHALAREQGVKEGARLAQVQVLELVVRVKLWGQRKCCNIYTWENAADTRACVMMLAPAMPKPTRRRPVCGDEQTEAKTDRHPPFPVHSTPKRRTSDLPDALGNHRRLVPPVTPTSPIHPPLSRPLPSRRYRWPGTTTTSTRAEGGAAALGGDVAVPVHIGEGVEGEFLDHGDDAVL